MRAELKVDGRARWLIGAGMVNPRFAPMAGPYVLLGSSYFHLGSTPERMVRVDREIEAEIRTKLTEPSNS
jgi:hypothetical protein